MRYPALCALLGAAVLARPVSAQNDCLKQLAWPAVGRWAEYRTTFNQKETTLRYAAVGAETRDGTPLKWIEMQTTVGSRPPNVYKLLLPGGPTDIPKVREIVIKSGTNPPMQLNGMMLGMVQKELEKNSIFANICDGVTVAGSETVKVPAGSFKSVRFHSDKYNSDTWISSAVPFSLVKSVTSSHQIELTATGDGAKSAIPETPKELGAPSR